MSTTLPRPDVMTYRRIPPAIPSREQPIIITEAEFDAVMAADTYTRDRYEYVVHGMPPRTSEDLRFFLHRGRRAPTLPSPEIQDAIAAVRAELVPLERLLAAVAVGLDRPELLASALAHLHAATLSLAELVPANPPPAAPAHHPG